MSTLTFLATRPKMGNDPSVKGPGHFKKVDWRNLVSILPETPGFAQQPAPRSFSIG